MDAFITRRGGAADGLNFRIVGGTAQPGNPKENTIWVNTETEIAEWSFSMSEPAEPVEGMVWISFSGVGNTEFNALSKNSIMICPVSVKQYINGTWADRLANIYQNGEWLAFELYVYKNGEQYEGITGGWSLYKHGTSGAACVFESDKIYLDNGYALTNHAIDMTPYKTMTMHLYLISRHSNGTGFQNCGLVTRGGSMLVAAHPNSLGTITQTFDISSVNEECFIRVSTGGSSYCTGYVYVVVLE